jgi:hypothetical protein
LALEVNDFEQIARFDLNGGCTPSIDDDVDNEFGVTCLRI